MQLKKDKKHLEFQTVLYMYALYEVMLVLMQHHVNAKFELNLVNSHKTF